MRTFDPLTSENIFVYNEVGGEGGMGLPLSVYQRRLA